MTFAVAIFLLHLWFLKGFFYSGSFAEGLAIGAALDVAEDMGLVVDSSFVTATEWASPWRPEEVPVWLSVLSIYNSRVETNVVRRWTVSNICHQYEERCYAWAVMLASGRVLAVVSESPYDVDRFPSLVPAPGKSEPE